MEMDSNIIEKTVDKPEDTHGSSTTGLEGEKTSAGSLGNLLTVQEICDLLKVPKTYIYSLTHQRKIPHIKMHGHLRFRQSDIDKWLRSQEVCDVGLQDKKQVVRLYHVPGRNKV